MAQAIRETDGGVLISVRVQPKASRNRFVVEPDGRIRVALTAPPVEGAANRMLVEFAAKCFGVAKRDVELVAGEKARNKTLRMMGISAETALRRLDSPERT